MIYLYNGSSGGQNAENHLLSFPSLTCEFSLRYFCLLSNMDRLASKLSYAQLWNYVTNTNDTSMPSVIGRPGCKKITCSCFQVQLRQFPPRFTSNEEDTEMPNLCSS